MKNNARLIVSVALVTMFVVAIGLNPTVKAAAKPCLPTCGISILSPGKGLNTNANVGPSFIVSFAVQNFTLAQSDSAPFSSLRTTSLDALDLVIFRS